MEEKLIEYKKAGFLESKSIDGDELLLLTTPCRFRINENIVSDLKNNYNSLEEIGGILWVKPTVKDGEITHIINTVSYIRNAIEDNPRADKNNKSNAYLPDFKQLNQILNDVFSKGYLPVKFHTHPVKGTTFLNSLTNLLLMTETSEQDKKESSHYLVIGKMKLLMPRALIVGSDISSKDIFIGVYNGFISPTEFENSKKKIHKENFKKIADFVSAMNFTDGQKAGLTIGAVLLLFAIVKHPKHSLPVIFGIGTTLNLLITNTQNIVNPNYFNKLSTGSADIFIPPTELATKLNSAK